MDVSGEEAVAEGAGGDELRWVRVWLVVFGWGFLRGGRDGLLEIGLRCVR